MPFSGQLPSVPLLYIMVTAPWDCCKSLIQASGVESKLQWSDVVVWGTGTLWCCVAKPASDDSRCTSLYCRTWSVFSITYYEKFQLAFKFVTFS